MYEALVEYSRLFLVPTSVSASRCRVSSLVRATSAHVWHYRHVQQTGYVQHVQQTGYVRHVQQTGYVRHVNGAMACVISHGDSKAGEGLDFSPPLLIT